MFYLQTEVHCACIGPVHTRQGAVRVNTKQEKKTLNDLITSCSSIDDALPDHATFEPRQAAK
jgi:hypothetical protein